MIIQIHISFFFFRWKEYIRSQLFIAVCSFTSSALNYSRFYAFSLLFSFVLTTLSILLNNMLIPHFGMEGAAVSNLIAYSIYFMLILFTVRMSIHASTFTRQHLKIVILIIAILIANSLWQKYLPINNIWLSSICRTILLLGLGSAIAWYKQLSPEINQQLRSIITRVQMKH